MYGHKMLGMLFHRMRRVGNRKGAKNFSIYLFVVCITTLSQYENKLSFTVYIQLYL
jgi:hypothetical protein